MNRRQLMMLSGAAAAASPSLAQSTRSAVTPRASAKVLLKFSRARSSYKIPKSDAKKVKFLGSLSSALTLTADQQSQADAIFSNAVTARAALRASLKTARQNLRYAVKNMDTASIERMSAAVAGLKAQRILIGARANASFFRTLTLDQQARLIQFQS